MLHDARWENVATIKQYLVKICCAKSKVKDRCEYNNYWPVCLNNLNALNAHKILVKPEASLTSHFLIVHF